MGVMEKMRNSTGVVLWILILSFGILWMLQGTGVFSSLGAGPRSLGSVNGDRITNKEYQSRINAYSNQYSQQTGNSLTPEMRAYYKEQAWNEIVTGKLLQQKMDQLGIVVTDQEVVNMIKGDNPDSFIKQQFANKDGSINRVALNAAIESKKNSQVWIAIEQQLREKRRQQKMSNYVQTAMQVSPYEIDQQYIRNNTTADLSYVRFPYAAISDSAVQVSDADLRGYYNNHEDRYKREKSYQFQYVSFDKRPTKEDTARTIKDARDLRADFAKAENDSSFLFRYQSTTPYNDQYVAEDQIRDLFKPVIKLDKGEVSQVIQDGSQVYLLKKIDEKGHKIHFAVLSFMIKADPVATVDKRAEEGDDFNFFAGKNGFEKEAQRRRLTIKKASATKGNDFIAGLGQSRQIMDVLKESGEGDISKPIELASQFVVLHVTKITPEGTRPFDEVKNQIHTTVLNKKRKEQIAQKVSGMMKNHADLQSLAEASGEKVVSVKSLTINSQTLEGAGREPEVIGAAFGLPQGKVSAPIKGTSAVFVIQTQNIQKADPKKMTAAAKQKIQQQLQLQKSKAFSQVWLDQLKKNADIVDNRAQLLKGR